MKKFRVWHHIFKKFLPSDEWFLSLDGKLYFVDFMNFEDGRYGDLVSVNQNSYVIQQFTGLTDKNGKEMYEGDIVKYWANENPEDLEWDILRVMFISGAFVVDNKGYEHLDEYIIGANRTKVDVEVIGNIFQNSVLLK